MRYEVKIGLLAIVATAITIWGYQFLKGKNILSSSTLLYVEYEKVDQLQASDPVYINGYQIGVVSDLYLKESDMQTIVAVLTIEKDIKIPKSAIAEIISTSFMGGKGIQLVFNKPCSGDDCAKNGDYLRGRTVGMLDSMVGGESIDSYMDELKEGITELFDTLTQKLTDPESENKIAESVQDVQATIENLKNSTNRLNILLQRSAPGIENTIANLSSLTETLNDNNDKIESVLENAEAISTDLKKADLGGTVNNADKAVKELQVTLQEASKAMADLNHVLTQVKSGDGTLGKLVYDEELYNQLDRSLTNLDLLLQDFRLNPKRYINVSVFGKKQKEYEKPSDDPAFTEE